MDNINIIIRPLVTEKSTRQQETRNAYSFQVHQTPISSRFAMRSRSSIR